VTDRVVLLVTTHRVAPGLLSWPAWETLRAADVLAGDSDHLQLPALAAAGIAVELLAGDAAADATATADLLRERCRGGRTVVWLAASAGDEHVARALGDLATRDPELEVELLHASYDVPGARLLDVVALMDRLRSPGGCPWDAEQTHASLAPYLLEEAYEAYQAIEDDDLDDLREELGDVLLQVAFHARVAEELPEGERWSIDDVAAHLVEKLIRRHPHVFGDREVSGAHEVVVNWDVIKAEEKGRASAVEGVPLAQAALALAAALQRKATKLGVPSDLVAGEPAAGETPAAAVAAAATAAEDAPGVAAIGAVLWAAVALARSLDVDPEAALRGHARRFRDRVAEVERAAHDSGLDVRDLDDVGWRERWPSA
jgi:XTP/dITP diphosphohydrolase